MRHAVSAVLILTWSACSGDAAQSTSPAPRSGVTAKPAPAKHDPSKVAEPRLRSRMGGSGTADCDMNMKDGFPATLRGEDVLVVSPCGSTWEPPPGGILPDDFDATHGHDFRILHVLGYLDDD